VKNIEREKTQYITIIVR